MIVKKLVVLTFLLGFSLGTGPVLAAPLTWEDCVKEASRNNPDLIAAGEVIYQAKASKAITASEVFPQLDANASAGESKSKTGSQKTATSNSYAYGLSGSFLIFDGLKSGNNIRAALANIVAAQESFRFSSADVRLKLRTAFVGLFKAQEMIRVTQEIAQIREDEIKLISLRYKAGLEHRGALLATQASMLQAKFDLQQAVRNLDLARRQLCKAMGRDEFAPLDITGAFVVEEIFHEKPDFKAIAQAHPSVRQAEAKRNSADFTLRAGRGSYLPQVSLRAGVNRDGVAWPPQDQEMNAQLVISLPVFEGGLRKAQVSQGASLLRQAEAQLKSTSETVLLGLKQAWEAFREGVEAVALARATLTANEERSKIAEVQYSTGFISYDNWTIIQDNVVQSKKAYLNARANALLAQAQWVYAEGVTLEYARQ